MSIFPKLFGHDKKLERFFRAVDFLEWGSMGRRCEEGPRVWLLVDIGARVTKIELVSCEGVICAKKLRMGGDDMDNAIMTYMRTVRRCCIDRRMAELVKAKVGSAWELDSELDFEVLGQDVDEGGVRTYRIDSREIREEALAGVFDRIEESLSDFMTHRVSREHVADIAKHGFILTEDCASLPGLDRRLAAAMGIPVRIYSEWGCVSGLSDPVCELAS